MKHWERWIIYPLLIIITIVALISLCQEHPRVVGLDYIGVIIGILTLLVTALIGGQVVNYLTFENRINHKIKKAKEEAKSEVGKGINDVLYHNMYLIFFFQGITELRNTQCEASLYYLFKSIECLMQTSIDRDKIDEIILKIKKIKQDFPRTMIPQNNIEEYIKIIASTGHKDSREIIEMLKSMKE
ncbi:hypothetical protein [Parabacteroides johnsonii]|jgi:hypothetical protein|uniref:hypothetical protein n=1 Tax=Parabacteroides johnsonii TaxID=387661 RepID=UPI002431045D|nr:hypothetical protein [Parabacteroides johnsonii]